MESPRGFARDNFTVFPRTRNMLRQIKQHLEDAGVHSHTPSDSECTSPQSTSPRPSPRGVHESVMDVLSGNDSTYQHNNAQASGPQQHYQGRIPASPSSPSVSLNSSSEIPMSGPFLTHVLPPTSSYSTAFTGYNYSVITMPSANFQAAPQPYHYTGYNQMYGYPDYQQCAPDTAGQYQAKQVDAGNSDAVDVTMNEPAVKKENFLSPTPLGEFEEELEAHEFDSSANWLAPVPLGEYSSMLPGDSMLRFCLL